MSGLSHNFFSVDCGSPGDPRNGFLTNYTGTTNGSVAFYSCDPGLVPVMGMRAVCTRNGWSPNPAGLNCTEHTSSKNAFNTLCGELVIEFVHRKMMHQAKYLLRRRKLLYTLARKRPYLTYRSNDQQLCGLHTIKQMRCSYS